jgi:hypothetical protein
MNAHPAGRFVSFISNEALSITIPPTNVVSYSYAEPPIILWAIGPAASPALEKYGDGSSDEGFTMGI